MPFNSKSHLRMAFLRKYGFGGGYGSDQKTAHFRG